MKLQEDKSKETEDSTPITATKSELADINENINMNLNKNINMNLNKNLNKNLNMNLNKNLNKNINMNLQLTKKSFEVHSANKVEVDDLVDSLENVETFEEKVSI